MRKFFLILLIIMLLIIECDRKNIFNNKKTINVIYMAQAGYQPDDFIKMTDLFEYISDINVNVTFVKYDEQHKNIVLSATNKEALYDVFALDLIWTADFASKKYCMDLTEKVNEVRDDITPAIIDAFSYNNKIWAMPFLANFQLFFYNKDIIKRAGYSSPPKTLEEMVEQMRVMKQKGIVEYPWSDSWNQKEGLICEYVWLTAAFGGDIFNDSGKPIFNDGPGLEALNFMVNLLEEGLVNPISLTSDEIMTKDTFISGKSAFTSNWTFQYAIMNDPDVSQVAGKCEMGLLPVSIKVIGKYDNNTVSVSGFQGLGILSNSKNKNEAWKYIKYITSPLVQKAFLQEMPVWKSVQNDSFVRKLDSTMDIKSIQIASVHHRPRVVKYPDVSSILQRYIHLALERKLKPKEALDKAVEEINNL